VAGHPELNTMGTALNMGGNDITSARNINATNGSFSQTVSGQTLNASGDMNTARLTAQQSVQSTGWISANGNISSSSNIAANGNITSNSSIAAAGNITSSSNIIANGNLSANNDVIANGTLRGNNDLVLGGVIKLNQVNSQGAGCDTWGAISRDSVGAVLSCQSGIWKLQSVPLDTFTVQSAGSCANLALQTAVCPAGSKMVSGGWIMTRWTEGGMHNNPDSSYPDPGSNSWVITTPNNQNRPSCFVSVANCARQ